MLKFSTKEVITLKVTKKVPKQRGRVENAQKSNTKQVIKWNTHTHTFLVVFTKLLSTDFKGTRTVFLKIQPTHQTILLSASRECLLSNIAHTTSK